MNVPGRGKKNWRWRATQHMLSAKEFQWLADLTQTSNRFALDQVSTMEAVS